ncbi:hypothetical protein STAQ_44810 [Allostella sp. ATCC 35155]|nr:hypothetical protein STAQ_44810 [Stella sp. ATCC 35155]
MFETRTRFRIGLVANDLVGLALCLFHMLLFAALSAVMWLTRPAGTPARSG